MELEINSSDAYGFGGGSETSDNKKNDSNFNSHKMKDEHKFKIDSNLKHANEERMKELTLDGLRRELAASETKLQTLIDALPKEFFDQRFVNKVKESHGLIALAEENATKNFIIKITEMGKAVGVFLQAEKGLLDYIKVVTDMKNDVNLAIVKGMSTLHKAPEEYIRIADEVWKANDEIKKAQDKWLNKKRQHWISAFFGGVVFTCCIIYGFVYLKDENVKYRDFYRYMENSYPKQFPSLDSAASIKVRQNESDR